MASNKDIITAINGLSVEIGIEVDTNEMKNEDLADLLSDMKAKKRDAELKTQADGEKKAKKKTGPVIAKGKSLTSMTGIKVAGDPVTADDFKGGKETFDSLVRKGYIKK